MCTYVGDILCPPIPPPPPTKKLKQFWRWTVFRERTTENSDSVYNTGISLQLCNSKKFQSDHVNVVRMYYNTKYIRRICDTNVLQFYNHKKTFGFRDNRQLLNTLISIDCSTNIAHQEVSWNGVREWDINTRLFLWNPLKRRRPKMSDYPLIGQLS